MTALTKTIRILTFRFDGQGFAALGLTDLVYGLAFTWLVGIGRYWDNPRVPLHQKLGLGSVAYVFLLSTFLFLLLWPLRPAHWRFIPLLTFIALASPPALLYAIPVEQMFSLDTATTINFWFLAAVALWRVCLLSRFLSRYALLQGFRLAVALVLPLAAIVLALTALNLERAVFEIMAGNMPRQHTSADGAYTFLFLISVLSVYLVPPVLINYVVLIALAWRRKQLPGAA